MDMSYLVAESPLLVSYMCLRIGDATQIYRLPVIERICAMLTFYAFLLRRRSCKEAGAGLLRQQRREELVAILTPLLCERSRAACHVQSRKVN